MKEVLNGAWKVTKIVAFTGVATLLLGAAIVVQKAVVKDGLEEVGAMGKRAKRWFDE